MSKTNLRKSASTSFQVYHHVNSSSSDTSTSSSSSENADTPLKRFNRLLRSSVARHWSFFRKEQPNLRSRGRSVSDAGLCSIVDNDLGFLDITMVAPRRSLQVIDHAARANIPSLSITSTGNFASGAAGGGCGAPRSAPATPLQLEPHSRSKHDKHAVKPLSGSAPSVRVSALASGDEAKDGKQPSKSRQKKFQRHFPQVGPEERVLNYYSCALVGDLLLQGHLYITKNYFAFYSNVFGYVTKLLIPTTSVLRITKEKVARIIPNAVGVCTRDERHVFGSLLSRDSTYKLMMLVWKANRVDELTVPKPEELRTSEVEASEYSPEDDSSSGGADHIDAPSVPLRPEPEAIIAAAGAAVIQPALLTGAAPPRRAPRWHALLLALALLLCCSALYFAYRLYAANEPHHVARVLQEDVSGDELYSELVRWRARLHGRAAAELHAFLTTNLLLLAKVRQSLEALSGVILTDMSQAAADINLDVPNETVFS
ncbi:GRAM domain-containing protein 2B-like isoform X4 [Vanessa tameamea]|uniref:GRAM domain-containing protein 2B-like isoform X4 n=1 Tax=Vanessa tameamea TaxID=334116 RepID=A0ABM4ANZ1_VANTA